MGADLEVEGASRIVGHTDSLDVTITVERGQATELELKAREFGEVIRLQCLKGGEGRWLGCLILTRVTALTARERRL